jgi:predicted DsbA family dithiol-disulfide isomerase
MTNTVTKEAVALIADRYRGQREAQRRASELGNHLDADLWNARACATVDTFADCMGLRWIEAARMLDNANVGNGQ